MLSNNIKYSLFIPILNFTLKNSYDSQITCVFSDFNADKLVFRIRMNEVIKITSSRSAQKKTKVNPLDQSDHIYILKSTSVLSNYDYL